MLPESLLYNFRGALSDNTGHSNIFFKFLRNNSFFSCIYSLLSLSVKRLSVLALCFVIMNVVKNLLTAQRMAVKVKIQFQ